VKRSEKSEEKIEEYPTNSSQQKQEENSPTKRDNEIKAKDTRLSEENKIEESPKLFTSISLPSKNEDQHDERDSPHLGRKHSDRPKNQRPKKEKEIIVNEPKKSEETPTHIDRREALEERERDRDERDYYDRK